MAKQNRKTTTTTTNRADKPERVLSATDCNRVIGNYIVGRKQWARPVICNPFTPHAGELLGDVLIQALAESEKLPVRSRSIAKQAAALIAANATNGTIKATAVN